MHLHRVPSENVVRYDGRGLGIGSINNGRGKAIEEHLRAGILAGDVSIRVQLSGSQCRRTETGAEDSHQLAGSNGPGRETGGIRNGPKNRSGLAHRQRDRHDNRHQSEIARYDGDGAPIRSQVQRGRVHDHRDARGSDADLGNHRKPVASVGREHCGRVSGPSRGAGQRDRFRRWVDSSQQG